MTRAILSQGRNLITWLRIIPPVIMLVLFPALRSWCSHVGFSNPLITVAFTVLLTMLPVLETAPNAISGEGSRFALFLTAPFHFTQLLFARLFIFLIPLLIETGGAGLVLSWWLGLSVIQIGFVLLTTVLIVTGSTALMVLGSAWDLDLHMFVEGMEQRLLQEEAPFSPRRLVLFNGALVCCLGMFFLLWKLPTCIALSVIVLLTCILVVGTWRFSLLCIRYTIKFPSETR